MITASSKYPIFRSKTLQNYMQKREKCVLPRIIAPPVFALSWIILMLLIVAGIAVWSGQVPVYIDGSGIILVTKSIDNPGADTTAVVLLPASSGTYIRPGQLIELQIGQAGPQLHRTISAIHQKLLSPGEIRQRYGFTVTDPSLVMTVGLGSTIPEDLYSGSPVRARIQVGSQSLLALFPIISSLSKGQ